MEERSEHPHTRRCELNLTDPEQQMLFHWDGGEQGAQCQTIHLMQEQVAKCISVISINGCFHSLQKLGSVIGVHQLLGRQELCPLVCVHCMLFLLLAQQTGQQIIADVLEALKLCKRQVLG